MLTGHVGDHKSSRLRPSSTYSHAKPTRRLASSQVTDYFAMLDLELRGLPYNKTEHRRHLAGLLDSRSDGAIERKHQNISAALIELGFPYIAGYKPLRNYQHLLFKVVSDRLEGNHELSDLVRAEVDKPATAPTVEDILMALVDPPARDPSERRLPSEMVREKPRLPRPGVDYLAREAQNRSLGAAGEEFVMRFEVARLVHARQERLASMVERVSVTRGDGAGFDVLSFETSGRERLIEVKTTAYGSLTPFFVTRNELAVSQEEKESYHLYRTYEFRRQPKLFTKQGQLDQLFSLNAFQYVAKIV